VGQSGAPILLIDKTGKMTIIGIHKGGVNEGSSNVGRLLTQELIEKLKKQAVKLGA
jgi:V8-like Glu-specific endopeptidase